jgi:hypothetical protein
MSKMKPKKEHIFVPKSDWFTDPWNASMFKRHEADFREILKEYQTIKEKCASAVMARWYWLQSKRVVRIEWKENAQGTKYADFIINERYPEFSSMFSRFTEWLSFEEVKEARNAGDKPKSLKEVLAEVSDDTEARMKCFHEPIEFKPKQEELLNNYF